MITDGDFWTDIKNRLISDADSVKLMIKNKAMTIYDRDLQERTILIKASQFGCYELVQFCKSFLIYIFKNNKPKIRILCVFLIMK